MEEYHQIVTRICVAVGIRHMYRQYRESKINHAQILAAIDPSIPFPVRRQDNQMEWDEVLAKEFENVMMRRHCNFRRNS
jgi:hypothetical protein